jgi:hypothetical protein
VRDLSQAQKENSYLFCHQTVQCGTVDRCTSYSILTENNMTLKQNRPFKFAEDIIEPLLFKAIEFCAKAD